jgi:hypothetical protein
MTVNEAKSPAKDAASIRPNNAKAPVLGVTSTLTNPAKIAPLTTVNAPAHPNALPANYGRTDIAPIKNPKTTGDIENIAISTSGAPAIKT